jgi:uncharacterized protein (TIGR03382 family)
MVRADKVFAWAEKVSKRTLARAKCDGSGAGSNQDDGDDSSEGGCSAGTGGLEYGLVVVAAMMWLLTARRREARVRK